MPYIIRPAVLDDADSIAEVNIQSWRETYPGIMPAARLASLDQDRCAQNWKRNLQADVNPASVVLVAEMDSRIVGFVSGGANRRPGNCSTGASANCDCELMTLYLLQSFHRQGIGRSLFDAFRGKMRSQGYTSMVVWVAAKNPATLFYASMGGIRSDSRTEMIGDAELPELAYIYTL